MGTIKSNCFNLIGNFSSFCLLFAFRIQFFGPLRCYALDGNINKANAAVEEPVTVLEAFLHVLISGDFSHNWYATMLRGWSESWVATGIRKIGVECIFIWCNYFALVLFCLARCGRWGWLRIFHYSCWENLEVYKRFSQCELESGNYILGHSFQIDFIANLFYI